MTTGRKVTLGSLGAGGLIAAALSLFSPGTIENVSFGTHDGRHFLTVEENDTVNATRDHAFAWQELDVEPAADGWFYLKTWRNRYLSAQPDGTLEANRTWTREWERFKFIGASGGVGCLQTWHGLFVVAEGGGGGEVRANRLACGPWETLKPSKPLRGGPGSGPGPPAGSLGALTVEGNRRWLAANGERHDLREVSSFALQSRMMRGEAETQVRPLILQFHDLRFTQTRVLLTLGGPYWDTNNPIGYSLRSDPGDPGWWENLDRLVDIHEEEAMYVRLTLIGALEPFGGVWIRGTDIFHGEVRRKAEAFAEAVVRRYAGRSHVLFEIANEPSQISMNRSSQAIADMVCRFKQIAPNNIVHSGDINSMDFAVQTRCDDIFDAHLPRDSGLDFLEAVKRSGEVPVRDQQPRPAPAMSGEPMNMGEWRVDGNNGDVAREPIAAFAYGGLCRVRQFLCNFHYDGGLWSTPPKPETLASIEAFHAGLDAIPMLTDERWRGTQGNNGNPLNYWDYRMSPGSDVISEVERHIREGRGPFRVFGIGPWSMSIAEPPGWDATRWQRAPADRRHYRANSRYGVGIYERR